MALFQPRRGEPVEARRLTCPTVVHYQHRELLFRPGDWVVIQPLCDHIVFWADADFRLQHTPCADDGTRLLERQYDPVADEVRPAVPIEALQTGHRYVFVLGPEHGPAVRGVFQEQEDNTLWVRKELSSGVLSEGLTGLGVPTVVYVLPAVPYVVG